MMASMAASLIEPMASLLIQPVTSSLINAISGKRVIRAGRRHKGGFLSLLALPLMMKVLGKRATRAGKGYNNMNHMAKRFKFHSIL